MSWTRSLPRRKPGQTEGILKMVMPMPSMVAPLAGGTGAAESPLAVGMRALPGGTGTQPSPIATSMRAIVPVGAGFGSNSPFGTPPPVGASYTPPPPGYRPGDGGGPRYSMGATGSITDSGGGIAPSQYTMPGGTPSVSLPDPGMTSVGRNATEIGQQAASAANMQSLYETARPFGYGR